MHQLVKQTAAKRRVDRLGEDGLAHRVVCDVCGTRIALNGANTKNDYYTCEENCDFDLCTKCVETAYQGAMN